MHFDEAAIGADVEAYFVKVESGFDDITPGVEKRVVWAGAKGALTDLVVLYVHGFSATSEEVRPLPDLVAQALGANLVFTRLAGHGRGDGPALGEARFADWMEDMAEALAVSRRVGRQVIVMSTSTGGTLSALAAVESMARGVAGMVMISPNFRVKAPGAFLLNWPGARWWAPLLVGTERQIEVRSEAHGRFNTTRYPTTALLPMGEAVRTARRIPYEEITVPALFVFDEGDQVVDSAVTRKVAARWGAACEVLEVTVGPQDDPYRHVIAGHVLSAGMTAGLADKVVAWVRGLS